MAALFLQSWPNGDCHIGESSKGIYPARVSLSWTHLRLILSLNNIIETLFAIGKSSV